MQVNRRFYRFFHGVFFLASCSSLLFSTKLLSKENSRDCSSKLVLLNGFVNHSQLQRKISPGLTRRVNIKKMTDQELDQFKTSLMGLVVSLMRDPMEGPYFQKYFDAKFNNWEHLSELVESNPKVVIAILNEYRRLRKNSIHLLNLYARAYPGSFDRISESKPSWSRLLNFYEFLEFYDRLQARRGNLSAQNDLPKILFDSNLYSRDSQRVLDKFSTLFRMRLGDFNYMVVPQVILEVGDHFRNREAEFTNLYPAFHRELTSKEKKDYQWLVREIVRLRRIQSPRSDSEVTGDDLILAQALFTGVDYFITRDVNFYRRIVDHGPDVVRVDSRISQLDLGPIQFRMKRIGLISPISGRLYSTRISLLTPSTAPRYRRQWNRVFGRLYPLDQVPR